MDEAAEINAAEAELDGELYRTAPAVWQAFDAQTAEFDVNADDDGSQNEFAVQYSFSIKAGNGKAMAPRNVRVFSDTDVALVKDNESISTCGRVQSKTEVRNGGFIEERFAGDAAGLRAHISELDKDSAEKVPQIKLPKRGATKVWMQAQADKLRIWQARKELQEVEPEGVIFVLRRHWKREHLMVGRLAELEEAAALEAEKVKLLPRESDEVKVHLKKLEELAAVRSEAKLQWTHPLPPAQHTVTRYICKTVKSGNAGKAQMRERAQSPRAIAVKVNDALHLDAVMSKTEIDQDGMPSIKCATRRNLWFDVQVNKRRRSVAQRLEQSVIVMELDTEGYPDTERQDNAEALAAVGKLVLALDQVADFVAWKRSGMVTRTSPPPLSAFAEGAQAATLLAGRARRIQTCQAQDLALLAAMAVGDLPGEENISAGARIKSHPLRTRIANAATVIPGECGCKWTCEIRTYTDLPGSFAVVSAPGNSHACTLPQQQFRQPMSESVRSVIFGWLKTGLTNRAILDKLADPQSVTAAGLDDRAEELLLVTNAKLKGLRERAGCSATLHPQDEVDVQMFVEQHIKAAANGDEPLLIRALKPYNETYDSGKWIGLDSILFNDCSLRREDFLIFGMVRAVLRDLIERELMVLIATYLHCLFTCCSYFFCPHTPCRDRVRWPTEQHHGAPVPLQRCRSLH